LSAGGADAAPPGGAFAAEIEVARAAAVEAGEIILAHRRAGFVAEVKEPGDPVTAADRDADAAIRARLAAAFSQDAILSEETADDGSRSGARRLWIVDPLDGTKDFVGGSDEFAVHVGLAVDGVPAAGVVGRPAGARLWAAERGGGAFAFEGGTRSALGPALSGGAPSRPLRVAVTRYHHSRALRRLLQLLPRHELVPCGSVGLKAALVAEGVCDAYFAPTPHLAEWDLCAPHAIAEAAGIVCTDLLGRPLRYNQPHPYAASGVLFAAPAWHPLLLESIAPLCRELDWLGG
jgi:3'(2'),5'-bisphosphate nucleotidase